MHGFHFQVKLRQLKYIPDQLIHGIDGRLSLFDRPGLLGIQQPGMRQKLQETGDSGDRVFQVTRSSRNQIILDLAPT